LSPSPDQRENPQVSAKIVSASDMVTRSTTAGRDRAVTDARADAPPPSTQSDADGLATLRVPGPDSPVWDVPWLADLRDVPDNASWPRLMTVPHPRAVGSYGREVERQFLERRGQEPRWWLRLSWRRILEHDRDGNLVWLYWLQTTARQQGKSWSLQELGLWRLHQVDRWGDQLVLHTGKDLPILREVLEPLLDWADHHGMSVSRRNGEWGFGHSRPGADGRLRRGRWEARSWRQVFGYSAGLGLVDETWKVPPRAVNDGILPTLVEQRSPQLGLVSTAHPEATGTFLDRRALAGAQLFAPELTLLLEWSAPRDLDLDDPRGWRAASPHWTEQRRQLVADALSGALRGTSDPEDPDPVGSFRCQWLNQWPQDVAAPQDPEELLATEEQWQALQDAAAAPAPGTPVVVAVDDHLGTSAAAAAAALTADGRVVVGGWQFSTLREAVDWAEDTAGEDGLLLAGASLVGGKDEPMDPELEGVDLAVEAAGQVETRDGLPQLRALVRGGRLAHDGGEDVSRSVLAAKVRTSKAGALLVDPDALLRCVVWAAQRAWRDRE
jgi:hypothetical protein